MPQEVEVSVSFVKLAACIFFYLCFWLFGKAYSPLKHTQQWSEL